MGIVIHGPCEICHRSSTLVIEDRYCSEVCQTRAKARRACLVQPPLTLRQPPPPDLFFRLMLCLLVVTALGLALALYLAGHPSVLEQP